MGNLLDEYPDLMTKEEVAKILRIRASMVHRIGLKKTRIGNGRGVIRYRKEDVTEYINSRVEREGVIIDAGQQKERHRKMGVSSLLPWEELQKARLGRAGGGT
ncbi:MAG: hypothetical protein ABSH06_23480 [Thermodesulfobacteriota bacterium]|jgi:hypothetical protein